MARGTGRTSTPSRSPPLSGSTGTGTIRPHSAIGMRTPTEHETAWLPDTDNVGQQNISQPKPATTGARQTSLHVDTDRVPSTISWALGSRSFTIGTWSLRAWAIRGV
ncbi:MAG: hypothetical protein ACFNLH_03735 [Corynebacterium matruchotii]